MSKALREDAELLVSEDLPGGPQSRDLCKAIANLITSNCDGEPPQEIFERICRLSIEAYGDCEGDLTKNHAASILLGYLLHSFQNYLNLGSDKYPARLTKSFGLIGIRGGVYTHLQRSNIRQAYSSSFFVSCAIGKSPKECKRLAEINAYELHYKRRWIKDAEGNSRNMKAIRGILKSTHFPL
ncbi:hypothetical protein G6698_06515 [Polynucleobacter paneuropaeus]|nr:hypothetical protein [Polynucleobacter paneuropaeus]MBT8577341.1 hypothetical protein [Polynucleobacter paneuropaeus]